MHSNPVSDYLDRMAPTQSHENRRQLQNAAKLLRGVDIGSDAVALSIPVYENDNHIGYANVMISRCESLVGNATVDAYFVESNADDVRESIFTGGVK